MALKLFLLALAALVAGAAIMLAWALVSNGAKLFAPPGWSTRLATYLTRNAVDTRADHPFPELRTMSFEHPPSRVSGALAQALEELGWRVTRADPDAGRWQAVVRTPLLGFRDDVTIVLDRGGDGGTTLDVHSRSRVGRADLGANRAHVLALEEAVHGTLRGG